MIKDTKINDLFGIPIRTIQDMKNADKDNWRLKVYTFLKNQDEEALKDFLSKINSHEKNQNS